MRIARPIQGRVAGLKAPRYINIENALVACLFRFTTGRSASRPEHRRSTSRVI